MSHKILLFIQKPSSLQWYWYKRLQGISYLLLTRNIIPRWAKNIQKKKNIILGNWIKISIEFCGYIEYRKQRYIFILWCLICIHNRIDSILITTFDIWPLFPFSVFLSIVPSCFAVLLNQMDHITHEVFEKRKIKEKN